MARTSMRFRALSAILAAATVAAVGVAGTQGGAVAADFGLAGSVTPATPATELAALQEQQSRQVEGLLVGVATGITTEQATSLRLVGSIEASLAASRDLNAAAVLAAPTAAPVAAPKTTRKTTTTKSTVTAKTLPIIDGAAAKVIADAKRYLGAPYLRGATGPSAFDCSGLTYRVFSDVGLASRIGGHQSAAGYLSWFRSRGLASTSNPRPGDLVIWGNGTHVGIYIGSGMAISALTSGVRIHAVNALFDPFTAYLHTYLG